MKFKAFTLSFCALAALMFFANSASAQGTAFTYQGRLNVDGAAAEGPFDLVFGLYTNVTSGVAAGGTETNLAVGVTNGLFVATLNFTNAFNGTPYWLGIGVRTNGNTGGFTNLEPRQPLTPTPYAITASNLTGTLPATHLSGTLPSSAFTGSFSNSVSLTNSSNIFRGNGAGLTGVPSPTQTNYFQAYDTTVQGLSTAGAFQTITFSTASLDGGWLFTPGTGAFTASQAGLYLISYQAHIQNLTTSGMTAEVRLLDNGTTITGAESAVSLPGAFTDGFTQADKTFLVSVTAGAVLQLQFTSNADVELIAGSFAGEFLPSATVTIVRLQ